ncbi:MAG: hypothetical protein H6618_00315 [Deltaproteobacteria bacterium]|nr:hypothetical protein [Deltaproteobacteria bacterium]
MTAQCRQDHAGQPVRARIVVFSDEEGSNTQYQWKEVVFNTLTDPDTMNGLYAQVVGNAEFRLEESQEEGSTEAAPGSYKLKGGDAVQLAYKMQDGVLHPLDYHSMLMLSMYYHYEKIVEFWRIIWGWILMFLVNGVWFMLLKLQQEIKGKSAGLSN